MGTCMSRAKKSNHESYKQKSDYESEAQKSDYESETWDGSTDSAQLMDPTCEMAQILRRHQRELVDSSRNVDSGYDAKKTEENSDLNKQIDEKTSNNIDVVGTRGSHTHDLEPLEDKEWNRYYISEKQSFNEDERIPMFSISRDKIEYTNIVYV